MAPRMIRGGTDSAHNSQTAFQPKAIDEFWLLPKTKIEDAERRLAPDSPDAGAAKGEDASDARGEARWHLGGLNGNRGHERICGHTTCAFNRNGAARYKGAPLPWKRHSP